MYRYTYIPMTTILLHKTQTNPNTWKWQAERIRNKKINTANPVRKKHIGNLKMKLISTQWSTAVYRFSIFTLTHMVYTHGCTLYFKFTHSRYSANITSLHTVYVISVHVVYRFSIFQSVYTVLYTLTVYVQCEHIQRTDNIKHQCILYT